MKIKQLFKKAAAMVMATVTVLSLLPTTAFAATGDVGTALDLLMTILAFHTEEREVPGLANDAHDLIDKRMRFSRLCTDLDGRQYVDIFMYEDEAVEMIWQFLFAAADADMAVCDYHSRLQKGGVR